ncbi:GAF and ANTAR domain-containing protein [Gordonia sp. CPCC 205515]|uniref:GAF and ANTAR domain-containing protein n=1 Tax=Gordonia sp. CPCC 205515 TaxID=3140791 RepID=UPI003AF3FE3C
MTVDISVRMAGLVRDLHVESSDTEAMLRGMSKAAVSTVPGAEYASVTLVTRGRIETPVMVGDLAGSSDDLQRELIEGPCLRAALDDSTILIRDMSQETRWPRFAPAATELGILSMVCFCLYIDGKDSAALNLHSTRRDAFDADARALGELFAAHCATAFATVREREQLRSALTSRDIIGQAKGMLMERYGIDADAAFALLARLSQETNTKLVAVAEQLVLAGPDQRR